MGRPESDLCRCFKILELDPGASLDDLRKAFRKIVKNWHPDLFADRPKLKAAAEDKLKAVNAAHHAVKSHIMSRKKMVPENETSDSTHSNPSPAFFPDPFSRFRMQRLNSFLAAYIKGMKPENQPSHFVHRETMPEPQRNQCRTAKSFKQILKEVQQQNTKPFRDLFEPLFPLKGTAATLP